MKDSDNLKLAAPCGLYCGVCLDYLKKICHGCHCTCGTCGSSECHEDCDIYKCCLKEKGLDSCCDCSELPCSRLIQFCYSPIWSTHFPIIENLRRQKTIGIEKWAKEQREVWSNEKNLKRRVWQEKKCKNELQKFQKEK